MSMLDVHREALASVNEAHHLFMLRYRKDKKTVYGIVEGKDDPMFYRSAIERFLPDNWSIDLIPAGNKDKVIDIFEALDWRSFSPRHVAFFVDRDLNEFVPSRRIDAENVYITDGYSIENDIATPNVAGRILIEAYNIVDISDGELEELINVFANGLHNFQELLAPIMAQIIAWRRDGSSANLDNLNLSRIFKIEKCAIRLSEEFTTDMELINYASSCVGARAYPIDKIEEILEVFLSSNGTKRYTRGKYLMWFMSKFISDIHRNISLHTRYSTPPKVKIETGPANIMVIAAPRAKIPTSLRLFIEKTFLAHIGAAANQFSIPLAEA